MRVVNLIAGGLFDVRFSRRRVVVATKKKMGGEVPSKERMKAFCLISRVIDPNSKGKDNYERLIEVSVFDTRCPNKPLARKRSLAKALRELDMPREQRMAFWGAYFNKFGLEEFDRFPDNVLELMNGVVKVA
jgi:hypothetical protein